MYYVYLLESKNDRSWYIGYTSDLRARFTRHNNGQGARTTARQPHSWVLIYYEAYLLETDALGRERFLKSGSGRKYLKKQLSSYLGKNQIESGFATM